MFRSKKELEKKIAELKSELFIEKDKNRQSALIQKEALPKCKGLYCFHCIYAIYKHDRYGDGYLLLGCGKDAECKNFTPAYDKTKIESCPSAQQAFQVD